MKVCQTCHQRYPEAATVCPADGQHLVELAKPGEGSLVGQRMFGDYVIERKLGEGGMGAVYLAKHETIDQEIAVKVLHGAAAANSELVQRFNREARVIAKLTHPNIIRVFIFGTTPEGLLYLAMEYVRGQSLRQLIEANGKLSEPHIVYILKQILGAVAEAHDFGIVHRDLKPDNILLTEYRGNEEFVKVLDFGIAKVREPEGAVQQQLTQAGVVYGTPDYLSPEQAMGKPLDARSDLYSIGVILWEMLTGDVPYKADNSMAVLIQHAFDPPPDPDKAPVSISPDMKAVLRKVLAKGADDRYQTADEFLRALEQCEENLQQSGAFASASDIPVQKTELWVPPAEIAELAQQTMAQHQAHAPQHQGGPMAGSPQSWSTHPQHRATEGMRATTGRRVVVGLIVVGLLSLALMAGLVLFLVK